MTPFDPRVLHAVPATRRPVAALAVIGVAQGVATIGTAFSRCVWKRDQRRTATKRIGKRKRPMAMKLGMPVCTISGVTRR